MALKNEMDERRAKFESSGIFKSIKLYSAHEILMPRIKLCWS